MHIGYLEWHEGIGYDLTALERSTPEERQQAEELLLSRVSQDWRDVQALDRLATPRALEALQTALGSSNLEVRIEAARLLERRNLLAPPLIESLILDSLRVATLTSGMARVLDYAEAHPTEAVRKELLRCALHGNDDIRVHAAALAHFLYGKSASAFDWAHRPLYLRFGSRRRSERNAAYRELCRSIGIEPSAARAR